MKKLILSIALLAQAKFYGQALPNGGFENWSSISYMDPTGYNTGNERDVSRMGIPSVTRVTGVTGFAVRVENNVVGQDTSDSYFININNPCSDPPTWIGGVPYSQQPTAITGQYRYNLLGSDSGMLIVIFRKNGVHIGDNFILFRGTGSQSTFTPFSFTVNCAGVPDSVIIAAASSNKNSNIASNAGSFIELDNLAFAGASQPIPNGDFETWTTKSYDTPTGWKSWGQGASQTTSSYAGTYAMKLKTTNDCGGVNDAGITTGYMSKNSGPKGGSPYTKTTDTLCGYYKYAPAGNDTAIININLSKNGAIVGGTAKKMLSSAAYIYFQIPFSSGLTPDSIRIDIQSSKWNSSPSNIGSILYVDNLYLKSSPLGIFENGSENITVSSFPNPAKDVLYIRGEKNNSGQILSIYDAIGRIVKTETYSGTENTLEVNVSSLRTGLYFFTIKSTDGNSVRSRFIKE